VRERHTIMEENEGTVDKKEGMEKYSRDGDMTSTTKTIKESQIRDTQKITRNIRWMKKREKKKKSIKRKLYGDRDKTLRGRVTLKKLQQMAMVRCGSS